MEDRCIYKHREGKYDGYSFRYTKEGGLEKMTGNPNRLLVIKEPDIDENEWEISYALLEGMMGKYKFEQLKNKNGEHFPPTNKQKQ